MIQELLEGLAMLLDERGVALYKPEGGGSIFLEGLPERAEHCLSLTVYGGEQETLLPGVVTRPRIQVMARGDRNSPRWSREAQERAYVVLNGFHGSLPNGADVHILWALQSTAAYLGPDAAGCFGHSQNYQATLGEHITVPNPEERHGRRDHQSEGLLQHSGSAGRAVHLR